MSEESRDNLWQAQWIWGGDLSATREPQHRHYYFRRALEIETQPVEPATLRVCADTRRQRQPCQNRELTLRCA